MHNGAWRQNGEGERVRLCETPRHHTLKREGEGWAAGTAVPDSAASYTLPSTHFNRKPEREACPCTTARSGRKERERAGTAVPDTTSSYTQPRGAQQRVAAEMGGIAGTAVPDAAASYTQTRGGGWRAGTAVPDTAASYTPPPTHFNLKPE